MADNIHKNWIKEVQDRAKKVPVLSGRSDKWENPRSAGFDDLVFLPAQLKKKPVDYFKEPIGSKTIIGRLSRKPVELEVPILIGAMSFGALSREAKTVLAKASTLAGTAENTGEGGVLPEEREFAKTLIIQYSTGRFGLSEEILKKADLIEVKIGQGAKPGQGGLLPKEKVTLEIAEVRKMELGHDIHSPAYHRDINNINDLKERIEWLKKITGGAPVILKIAAGSVEDDLRLALQANPDIIAIDGCEGGTGAAPEVMLHELGVPTLPALIRARAVLDEMGAKQELLIGGGFTNGGEMAKALALGADAVFCATSLLVAMGCTYCKLCYTGKCPKGITTQDSELRQKLNVKEASQGVADFIKNCTEEMKMIAGACGENDVHKLNKSHLRSLNSEAEKVTKINMV